MPSDSKYLQNYQQDERYLEFYMSQPDALVIIQQAINWSEELPRRNYQFVVENKNLEVIGCAGVRTGDCVPGEAEIGIEFDPEHWRQGYAREALKALIAFAQSIDVKVLHASTNRRNFRAINLMQSESFIEQHVEDNDIVLSRCLEGTA